MEVYQTITMMIIYKPINRISLRYVKKNSYVVLEGRCSIPGVSYSEEIGKRFESWMVHHQGQKVL